MPPKSLDFTIIKKVQDLKLKEELDEVYCYMDFNKETIEPMYNDEIKLPINIIKLVQKQLGSIKKIPTKKVFSMVKDIKIMYDKVKNPDTLVIDIYLNVSN